MTDRNTGGYAFAAMGIGPAGDIYHETGMTLRDYFATHADVGKLEFANLDSLFEFLGMDASHRELNTSELMELYAKAAIKARYIYADAMIEARDK